MELRLFIIACIMYGFMWFTRWLKKKDLLSTFAVFGKWHGAFLFLALSCAAYLITFILQGGITEPFLTYPFWILECMALLASLFGYSFAQQIENKNKDVIIKKDLDWCNTIYFAGFVASIIMFFFIQAFKIPSASMRNTLQEGDHLFVNKAIVSGNHPDTNDTEYGYNNNDR